MSQLTYPSGYALLAARLAEFGAFRKRWRWLHALAWFVMLGPGSLLALMLLDSAIPLKWFILLPLFVLSLGLIMYAVVRYALWPLVDHVEIEREAVEVETLHGRLDNQIIGSLQLGGEVARAQSEGKSLGYSSSFVSTLISCTAENIGAINLPGLIDRRRALRDIKIAAAVLICLLIVSAVPGFVAHRIDHLRDAYATMMDLIFPVELRVTPGDVALVRGKPVSLAVQVVGARRRNVRLIRTDLKTKVTATDDLQLANERVSFEIARVAESFSYQFEYGGRRTPEHKVLAGDLPALAAMNTELAYPAYTGMPARTLVGRLPRIQALVGTGVLVSLASTINLHPELSYVTWQDGSRQPLAVTGRFAHLSFNLDRPEHATIHLTGSLGKGFEMPESISFEVDAQRDAPPTVEVLLRNRKMTMLAEEATQFGVSAIAEDDFGVAEVLLDYKIDSVDPLISRPLRQATISRLIDPPKDRAKVSFMEIFKTLSPPLEPGDRITINVSAKDNNTETGPGVGRAAPIEIVIVRPDLGAYVEQEFGFGSDPLLGDLRKVQRATNLLVEAEKTAHTEIKATVEKQDVKSRVGPEGWPGGAEDAVGDYFRLLSGEK